MANRILYITGSEADILQDVLLSGLVKRLGHNRIYDWPFCSRVYLRRKAYPRTSIRRSRLSLFSRFRASGPPGDFAAVVVASCKPSALRNYQRIQHLIPAKVPVLWLDGGDRTALGGDLERLGAPTLLAEIEAKRPFDLILKRSTPVGHDYGRPTLPFPNAFNLDFLPRQRLPMRYDVTCWCVESHPIRVKVLDMLAGKFDCVANGTTRGQEARQYKRTGEFYLEELSRSRVVINLPGAGWDCLRYWEATALGVCMVTPPPEIEIIDDFVAGQEVVHCAPDCSDIVEVCAKWLADEAGRKRMGEAAAAKAAAKHSDVARADQVLAALAGRFGVRF